MVKTGNRVVMPGANMAHLIPQDYPPRLPPELWWEIFAEYRRGLPDWCEEQDRIKAAEEEKRREERVKEAIREREKREARLKAEQLLKKELEEMERLRWEMGMKRTVHRQVEEWQSYAYGKGRKMPQQWRVGRDD
jgi:hypothetical protein